MTLNDGAEGRAPLGVEQITAQPLVHTSSSKLHCFVVAGLDVLSSKLMGTTRGNEVAWSAARMSSAAPETASSATRQGFECGTVACPFDASSRSTTSHSVVPTRPGNLVSVNATNSPTKNRARSHLSAADKVADVNFHEVASTQLAVDCKVEQSPIPRPPLTIEIEPDRPNLLRLPEFPIVTLLSAEAGR
jgi:hypothetical protein